MREKDKQEEAGEVNAEKSHRAGGGAVGQDRTDIKDSANQQ